MDVERTCYRVMSSSIEKAKIAKLLLLADQGAVDKYHGQKLDEINFEGEAKSHIPCFFINKLCIHSST